MFEANVQGLAMLGRPCVGADPQSDDYRILAWRQGRRIFERSRTLGRLRHLWRWLTGRSHPLLDLKSLDATPSDQHYVGLRTVPLKRIVGSEGRCQDFDANFNPRQSATLERWLGVYTAIYQGTGLPPVNLIEVRGVYFVRDGHHRISVAHRLGKIDVEAEVTVWEVAGPMPWEVSAQTQAVAPRPAGALARA